MVGLGEGSGGGGGAAGSSMAGVGATREYGPSACCWRIIGAASSIGRMIVAPPRRTWGEGRRRHECMRQNGGVGEEGR